MKNLFIPIVMIVVSSLITSCDGQTKLPKEMPADVQMSFGSNGGMTLYYTSIEVAGNEIFYKARTPADKGKEVSWTAKLSLADKAALYAMFVENKFDQIKNEKNETITYDAGSEGVSLSFAPNVSYNVQSGANFPLSSANKRRYQNIANEFEKMAQKYESMSENPIAMSLADARKQALSFFETINTDKTGKTMYQAKFTPFFPTELNSENPTNWVSYAYASGFELSVIDGERTSKPFAKIIFDPVTQTAAFEKLSNKLEAGDIQGVKPLPTDDLAVLKTEPEVEKILLQTKTRAEFSAANSVSIAAFYQIWKKYNGVIYQQFADNHNEFNRWIDDQLLNNAVKK